MTDSTVMTFEVSRREQAIVKVDVAQHCAHYAKERAAFNGTDEEFVRQSLDIIGVVDLLHDEPTLDDGIVVESEPYDEEMFLIGTLPGPLERSQR